MSHLEEKAFFNLFCDAYQKCFGIPLSSPLTEAESKHFSNEILEQTGLVLGWKSIKNYSFYLLNQAEAKPENPSVVSLDTLARYLSNAPKTDEIKRKKDEAHFPYWFTYRDNLINTQVSDNQSIKNKFLKKKPILLFALILAILIVIGSYFFGQSTQTEDFLEDFDSLSQDSLSAKGWLLKNKTDYYWQKRNEKQGHLTLFTLQGDNYPDINKKVGIKNLLLKPINADCFSTEIHLSNFIPSQNWQQVGILLLEDSTYSSRSIRISMAYNDFFGGYKKPGEIIIQAISSTISDLSKPEEIAHFTLFTKDSAQINLIKNNLQKTALRIEKHNNNYRFLYATGTDNIFAFKEVINRNLPIKPKYAAIFAISGNTQKTAIMPVYIDSFYFKAIQCSD